jgi:hypothetical protein
MLADNGLNRSHRAHISMTSSPVPVRRSRRLANHTPVNYDVSTDEMENSDNEPWDSEDEEDEVVEEPSTASSMCVAFFRYATLILGSAVVINGFFLR